MQERRPEQGNVFESRQPPPTSTALPPTLPRLPRVLAGNAVAKLSGADQADQDELLLLLLLLVLLLLLLFWLLLPLLLFMIST